MSEQRIRCKNCGTEVPNMDHLVDHITDSHIIIDVLVDGVSDRYEVVHSG